MIDYEYYAREFCRELQRVEKEAGISLDTIQLIRRLKIQLGYSIPESVEEGTGSRIARKLK